MINLINIKQKIKVYKKENIKEHIFKFNACNYCVNTNLLQQILIVAKMKNPPLPNKSFKNVKPVMVFCFICGRQFGSKSFSIHLKICQEKFHNQQQMKINKEQRISLPQSPQLLQTILTENYESNTLKIYNQNAYQIFKYKVLSKCKYCERTFNYESLKVHQKGCDKKFKKLHNSHSVDILHFQKEYVKPKALLCCVCGRQFGTKSLKIHYPQCLEKFRNDQYTRCINPKDRRKPPQFSEQQVELINNKELWTSQQTQNFYNAAMGKFRNQSMMQCYNCKRKFIPESIDKHMKNCILINGNLNPQAHLKKVQSEKVLHFYQKNIVKPKTIMCFICGRQFGLTSLSIHQKQCVQKFKLQQKNKVKGQRKKIPQLPQQIIQGDYNIQNASTWQIEKLQKYNQLVSDTYNKKSLATCYICERTFFQQSLQKHIVHCQNNLQKLKFKRDKSHDERMTLQRCQSAQKVKHIAKSVEKQMIKPRVLMCFVCGRQFGLTSLPIHLKSCPQKFISEQMLKDKQKRKQLPELPQELKTPEFDLKCSVQWSSQKIQFYNKTVFDIYNKKSLQTCYLCLRTFFSQSLPKHMVYCQKYTVQKLQKLNKSNSLNEKQFETLKRHRQVLKEKQMKQSEYFAQAEKIKPKTLLCHICGRGFGLTSLKIHLPKCTQKFIILQNQKPLPQRKKIPSIQGQINLQDYDLKNSETWPRQKIQAYNEVCNRVYKHKSLTKCEYCQRTFFDEQIKKHISYCQKQTMKVLQKGKQLNQNQKVLLKKCKSAKQLQFLSMIPKINQNIRQPKILTCHICGRQFGISSLKIHLPQCKQKFIKQQELKPQNKRRRLPELTINSQDQYQLNQNQKFEDFDVNKAQLWTSEQIKKYNQICTQFYKKQALLICKYCDRSFFQQQLPKHIKFCEKQSIRRELKRNKSQKQTLANSEVSINLSDLDQKQKNNSPTSLKNSPLTPQSKTNSKNAVMSIIQEEDLESSISPNLKTSEQSAKQMSTKTKQFKLIALEIEDISYDQQKIVSQQNDKNVEKKVQKQIKIQQQIHQELKDEKMKKDFKRQKQSKYFEDKKFIPYNPSLKKHDTSMRTLKRSSTEYKLEVRLQQKDIQTPQKESQKSQKKECQHCQKKIKTNLYQRHIQMCRSNASMTGYLKQQTPKLKI